MHRHIQHYKAWYPFHFSVAVPWSKTQAGHAETWHLSVWLLKMSYKSRDCSRCLCPLIFSEEGGSWTGSSSIASAKFGQVKRPVISYLNTRLRGKYLRTICPCSLPTTAFISGIWPPQLLQSQDVSLTHQHCFDWSELKIGAGNWWYEIMKTARLWSGKQMDLFESTSLIAYVSVPFFSGIIPIKKKKTADRVWSYFPLPHAEISRETYLSGNCHIKSQLQAMYTLYSSFS